MNKIRLAILIAAAAVAACAGAAGAPLVCGGVRRQQADPADRRAVEDRVDESALVLLHRREGRRRRRRRRGVAKPARPARCRGAASSAATSSSETPSSSTATWPRTDRTSSMRGASRCRMDGSCRVPRPAMAARAKPPRIRSTLTSSRRSKSRISSSGRGRLVAALLSALLAAARARIASAQGELTAVDVKSSRQSRASNCGRASGFERLLERHARHQARRQHRQGSARIQAAADAGRRGGAAAQPDGDDRSREPLHHRRHSAAQRQRPAVRGPAGREEGRVPVLVQLLPPDPDRTRARSTPTIPTRRSSAKRSADGKATRW